MHIVLNRQCMYLDECSIIVLCSIFIRGLLVVAVVAVVTTILFNHHHIFYHSNKPPQTIHQSSMKGKERRFVPIQQ